MICWNLIVISNDGSQSTIDLMSSEDKTIVLKETDNIQFSVTIADEELSNYGEPYVLIGDIPLDMHFLEYERGEHVFRSIAPLSEHSSKLFYNFFGESEIGLSFGNGDTYYYRTVNILARPENAKLAGEMFDYLTSNLDDAVSICFSRSRISGSHEYGEEFQFTQLDLIERTIQFLSEKLPVFTREHKHGWKSEIQFSERGQPTGPDSVHWVLTNLDRISPACEEESNLIYNNRAYKLDTLPKEGITTDTDMYENRVIHTFLYNANIFLVNVKNSFLESIHSGNESSHGDYIRFDHTMRKYAHLALRHRVNNVDRLLVSLENLKRFLSKKIPSEIVPGIKPKITSYVAGHQHYRELFTLIDKCYSAPAPTFEGNNVLFGLKNLAIVYETCSLLLINEAILRCFSVRTVEQSYRHHGEGLPFGGERKIRPNGQLNNYFSYRNDVFDIELLYEPMIYPFTQNSCEGDLVDTSNSRATGRYGKHHFCPDFVIKIQSKMWNKPVTIVLDSKYKDSATIRRFDIDELTRKYLLNIHQVNSKGRLDVSPVQLLLVLFPHAKTGSFVRTVAPRHTLTGDLPALPQVAAILLKPNSIARLDEQLRALISTMDAECSLDND